MTPEQIKNKLRDQWNEIHALHTNTVGFIEHKLGGIVINDEDFFLCSGSSRQGVHHYGTHGLIIHTNEVIDLMFLTKARLKLTTSDHLIFLSALWHDWGKILDHEYVNEQWKSTEHKYNIHHISRSAIEWSITARICEFKEEDEVTHAILSHHGQKAWGSPVEPRSELAWLLHISDHMSARLNDWKTIKEKI